MIRVLGYALILVILISVALVFYIFVPRASELSTVPVADTSSTAEITTKTETVSASTDTYRIEVHYPQFGILAVDEKIKAVVDTAVAEFKTYPANPLDSSVPQNELTGTFLRTYVGPDVVSVELSISEYTGGAHPNTIIIGVNVDRKTGKELTLDEALALIGRSLEQVAEQSLKELKVILGDNLISPEGAAPKVENYSTFLVNKDKVTFIFNNYQVAPYASGHQEVWFARK